MFNLYIWIFALGGAVRYDSCCGAGEAEIGSVFLSLYKFQPPLRIFILYKYFCSFNFVAKWNFSILFCQFVLFYFISTGTIRARGQNKRRKKGQNFIFRLRNFGHHSSQCGYFRVRNRNFCVTVGRCCFQWSPPSLRHICHFLFLNI